MNAYDYNLCPRCNHPTDQQWLDETSYMKTCGLCGFEYLIAFEAPESEMTDDLRVQLALWV